MSLCSAGVTVKALQAGTFCLQFKRQLFPVWHSVIKKMRTERADVHMKAHKNKIASYGNITACAPLPFVCSVTRVNAKVETFPIVCPT